MKSKTPHILFVALFVTALVTGCDKQENTQESKQEAMPDANDNTCTLDNQKKYGSEFADKCFLRGKFKPNSGRRW
jgi:entry exclusion lipoprotein TrbK